jgi:hypothetical protein
LANGKRGSLASTASILRPESAITIKLLLSPQLSHGGMIAAVALRVAL